MSDFVNYFAPLVQDERTPITQEPVKNGLRNRRSVACVARRRAIERQRTEDAQVEQNKSLTRNTRGLHTLRRGGTTYKNTHISKYLHRSYDRLCTSLLLRNKNSSKKKKKKKIIMARLVQHYTLQAMTCLECMSSLTGSCSSHQTPCRP
jgi:hypothetical protein